MSRRGFVAILALLVLVPALTGWAGDRCCPSDAPACAGARGDSHEGDGAAGKAGHESSGAGYPQALCGCACHVLCTSGAMSPLDRPVLLGRLELSPVPDRTDAFLTGIFRPPLA